VTDDRRPRRLRRHAIAPVVGLVVPDPTPRAHAGPVHYDPASLNRPAVERRQSVPTIIDDGHGDRHAIRIVPSLTTAARNLVDVAILDLAARLGAAPPTSPSYALTELPGGRISLSLTVTVDTASLNAHAETISKPTR
jgi:hypothetical protein